MIRARKFFLSSVIIGGAVFGAFAQEAAPLFSLDLTRGSFPNDVEVANLNGVLPDAEAYKHGYATTGWTVDRYESRGYVALSPTFSGTGKGCENRLLLPSMKIEKDIVLSWEGRSVYRNFPDSYKVVAVPEEGGDPIVLMDVEKESYLWERRTVDLNPVAGKNVRLGFICNSRKGYMLALSNVQVGERQEVTTEETPTTGSVSETNGDGYDFQRKYVVDRGTGTWCNNCPTGDLALDALEDQFGDRVIPLNTHINDVISNPEYWAWLKWYSIPRMMLNRIKRSEGENTKNFDSYLDLPTQFAVKVDGPEETDMGLQFTASVMVNEEVDNSEDRYRMAYVLTGDFYEPTNPRFRQENNCTQPSYGAYYFLPSKIPAALMYYKDVTLTGETAFTGIEGSLPASLVAGEEYEVKLDVDFPSWDYSPYDGRVVAYVLDTETGEIMNAGVKGIFDEPGEPEDPWARVSDIIVSGSNLSLSAADGCIYSNLMAGDEYTLDILSLEGITISSETGVAAGNDKFQLPDMEGLVIVRLSTAHGSKSIKCIL